MSSHDTSGTSTTVSLNDDGVPMDNAYLKWSCVTHNESNTSASILSSSKSISSIFSRIHCIAASVAHAAKSAPTYPCDSCATASKLTSGSNFIFFVCILKISSLPISSGIPMSISRSNRPNRLSAASIEFGRFVAAITMICDLDFSPSINVNNWDTILLSTSPFAFSLFGAIESISSIKIIAGAFASASSNAFLRFASDSPANFDMISGPLIKKKNAPVSFAVALAINVFPDPGGPYINIPLGGFIPIALNKSGCLNGNSTISLICCNCLLTPPISSYPISFNFDSSSSLAIGSPSACITVSGATIQ
mmetsp:Transcript_5983/g.8719  ORF Transcript_5983/g.8719 Transcript_5983/m.8719 type:complete len:307 (-) Transcript_5983:554-1474(-)